MNGYVRKYPEQQPYIKCFLLYWAVFSLVILSVSSLPHEFGEHVARNWILSLVALSIGASVKKTKGIVFYLVYLVAMSTTWFLQIYIAYDVMGYEGDNPINKWWLVLSIAFYLGLSAMLKTVLFRRFKIKE